MIRRSIFFWAFIISLTGVSMFLIKHEVQILNAKLNQLHHDVLTHQENISILKAEWSYLNQPGRIEGLARRHSDYRPTETKQIINIEDLPYPKQTNLVRGRINGN
jgi:hypothetical protein